MNIDTQTIGAYKLCNYGSRMFSLYHVPTERSVTLTEAQWASIRGNPTEAKCDTFWPDDQV